MNIGFVTAWCEQGAAYVTKQYMQLLQSDNNLYVYARGNAKNRIDSLWNQRYVTWAVRTPGTMCIVWNDLKRWIIKRHLDVIFFNEQQDMDILADVKMHMPNIKIGAYIDYYKRDTVDKHKIYDFLICNTKRHYSVFSWHPQCYYVPWGTDTNLYSCPEAKNKQNGRITFFHSAGNGLRKGTEEILRTFLHSDLCEKSDLIIHIQGDELQKLGYDYEELKKHNITIVEKTVEPPGLYYLGDVYLYPTILDGLGLTLYEALSCGLPVIGTDVAPINEIINDINGKKVEVERVISREDGYYWPLSYVSEKSLYRAMKYYVDHFNEIAQIKMNVRKWAIEELEWNDRKELVNRIFNESKILNNCDEDYLRHYKKKKTIGQKLDWIILYIYLNIFDRYKH